MMRRSDQYVDPIRDELEAAELSLEPPAPYDMARTLTGDGAPNPREPWDVMSLRAALQHHHAVLWRLEPRYKSLGVKVDTHGVRLDSYVVRLGREEQLNVTWRRIALGALAVAVLALGVAGVALWMALS